MCRKTKLIMRVVLSELMTHHPKPLYRSQIGGSGMQPEDIDNAIDCLVSEHYVHYNDDGSLELSPTFNAIG